MREYCEELVASADHMRPNFWPNTPDILHETLQHGGPPMFKIRAVLASLLSPSWGIYAGYELFEHVARPGAEEYLDNEKYQLRPRDWAAAERGGRVAGPVPRPLNAIRRDNPALHWLRNLRFHDDRQRRRCCAGPSTTRTPATRCWWSARSTRGTVQWGNTTLDMPALGFDWHERFTVRDELTGAELRLGAAQRGAPRPVPATGARVHRAPAGPGPARRAPT